MSSSPTWDPSWIPRLLGAAMIVHRTKIDASGAETQDAFWGLVMQVDPNAGVTLQLRGAYAGQLWPLPAGPEALSPAPTGPVTLPRSGEVVPQADYIATVVQRAA